MSLKQPIGQKRLTNVALVRYKKKGKRFEIACYKNKVVNWRAGVEKDLDEVLQTTAVFSNVSKGVLAKHEDLMDVFGTQDEEKICIQILNEGDFQVSDKERDVELDSLFKDVASVLAEKCVNPSSHRPYTISMLERALKDIHFSVDPKRGAKQQALEVLPKLKVKIPIERARMRLRARLPSSAPEGSSKKLEEFMHERGAVMESRETSETQEMLTCQVDPSCYRDIHSFVQDLTKCTGHVEVISLSVREQGEAHSQFDAWGRNRTPEAPASDPSIPAPQAERLQNGADALPSDVQKEHSRPVAQAHRGAISSTDEVVYSRGPVAGLPREFESRRERFLELDSLQDGWLVELRKKQAGSTVDAIFYSPNARSFKAHRTEYIGAGPPPQVKKSALSPTRGEPHCKLTRPSEKHRSA